MIALLSIARALTIRYYLAHPIRFATCVLGLTAGVAVASAINLTNARVISSFESSMEAVAGKSTLSLEPRGGISPQDLEKLRFAWDYGSFSPFMKLQAHVSGHAVTLYGFDFLSDSAVRSLEFNNASKANEVRTDGIIVPEDSPFGKLGDTVTLTLKGARHLFPITGILRAVDGHLPPQNTVYADLGQVLQFQPEFTGVDFFVEEGKTNELRKLLETHFPLATIRTLEERKQTSREMLAAFQMNLAALGVIALLVSAYLVYNTVNISVLQRESMLGILLSLGASPQVLFGAIILEGIIIGTLGALTGCALGWILSNGAHAEVTSTLTNVFRMDASGASSLDKTTLVGSFLVGVTASVIASILPGRRAVSIAAATARKQGRSEYKPARIRYAWIGALAVCPGIILAYLLALKFERAEPGFVAVAGIIALLSFLSPLAVIGCAIIVNQFKSGSAILASATARQHLMKISVATAALAVALSMAGSITIMVGSFRQTVQDWLSTVIVADIYLQGEASANARAADLDMALVERVRRLPFVRGVVTLRSAPGEFRGKPVELVSNNFADAVKLHGYSFVTGSKADILLARDESGVLVSEVFANKHRIARGDSIELLGRQVKVFAVYRNFSSERGYILMDDRLFAELVAKQGPGSLAIYLNSGFDAAEAMLKIRNALPDYPLTVTLSRDIRIRAMAIFDQTFRLTFALQWIAGGIAALSVLTTLAGLAIERQRDLASLLALGATPGRIYLSMALESQIIALSACALALPGSAALAVLLIKVINRFSFGWTIVADWSLEQLLPGLLMACILALAAAIAPIRLIHRQRLVESLKRG
ncbi:MAG: FtsX-like permease family protein [Spirochaetia bacterium]|nr:FtsX-like permease family protein [Spirochaetia bacterium]